MELPDFVNNWRNHGPPSVQYADPRPTVADPQDAVDALQALDSKACETDRARARSVHLDTVGKIMAVTELSIGDVGNTFTEPREILRDGLLNNAAMVLVLECRPVTNPKPTDLELEMWHRLSDAGRVVGLPILDHLLIGRHWVWTSLSRASR